jgi:nucleotide-binding universal stress UspA family protein
MSELPPLPVKTIFHPSDFSAASEVAFAHALRLALVARAQLRMLHVAPDSQTDWHDFPGVRETLVRWGLIQANSPRGAVADLGIDVRKVIAESDQPVRACLSYLEKHPADLIVLAVRTHEGRSSWLHRQVGEPIAKNSGLMTLFLPHGIPGFVSVQDGSVTLRNILIPITHKPRPQPAIEAVRRLVANLSIPPGRITLLHVGPAAEAPTLRLPELPGWTWEHQNRDGDPTIEILEAARELNTDLMVMTTDGPDGFLDGLRGTTSERVLREARCPILNLPAGTVLG